MWIDLGFLVFLIYGFYLGYSKGILKTIFAILSIFIAIILTMKFSPLLVDFVDNLLKLGPTFSLILGFVICFFVVLLLVRLIGKSVEKIFKAVKLNFINKIVGGVMMALLFVVSYSAILWFLSQTDMLSNQQKEQSVTYEQLEPIPNKARGAIEQLKPAFKGFWEKSMEAFDSPDNQEIQQKESIEER